MIPSILGRRRSRLLATVLATALAAGLVSACSDDPTVYPESNNRNVAGSTSTYSQRDTIFGPDGLNLFGNSTPEPGAGAAGIGVNSFLWRASLDTISFMPLSSADPFGGVIITDWYAPPEALAERFKVNLYILGRDLRADGVRAAVFRQRQETNGAWVDVEVDQQTAIELEDAILTRARQLRIASVQ